MTKYFRLSIAILMIVGLFVLAKSNIAWAAKSAGESGKPAAQSIGHSDQNAKDDCDKKPNSEKCKPPKPPRCNPKKQDCGSVKPPKPNVIIPVTGLYSIGGLCTVDVAFIGADINLLADVEDPLPSPLPENLFQMQQGCLLRYFHSDADPAVASVLPAAAIRANLASAQICFASIPEKHMKLYFFDVFSKDPKWVPLETTVIEGAACAKGDQSGVYVATYEILP